MAKKHRGRIQAQGEGLEKSVSWSQDDPLTKDQGRALLHKLDDQLTPAERRRREKQLAEARRYIEQTNGGIDALKKKTFRNRQSRDARIDIEVLSGTAFVAIALLLALLILLS